MKLEYRYVVVKDIEENETFEAYQFVVDGEPEENVYEVGNYYEVWLGSKYSTFETIQADGPTLIAEGLNEDQIEDFTHEIVCNNFDLIK